MPRIPSFAPQAVGTQPLAAPTVSPVADQAGQQLQQLGNATANAGIAGVSVFQRLQREYDDAKAAQGFALAAEAVEKGMYAPDGGYMTLQGQAALGKVREQKFLDIKKEVDRIATTLDSEEQRVIYSEQSSRLLREAAFKADVHQANQTRAFAIGSAKAKGDIALKSAVDHYGTKEYEVQRAIFLDTVDQLVELQGGSPEELQAARSNAVSVLHSETVQQLVSQGEVSRAAALMQEAGKDIEPETRRKLDGLVRNAGIDDQAQKLADSTMATTGSLVGAYDEIERLYREEGLPVEVRDRAKERAEQGVQQRRRAEESAKKAALSDALEWTAQGSPLTPQMRSALEQSGQLWKYEAVVESGGLIQTSPYGFRELHTATDEDLLRFKSPDEVWNHYYTELSNEDRPNMVAKWHRANEASGRAALRSAEQAQQDAIALNFDEEALFHFRRRPDVPDDWSPKGKDNRVSPAMFDTWKRSLRITANQITGTAGLKDVNTKIVTEAADSLLRPGNLQVLVDGTLRDRAALTTEQFQAGRVALSPDVAKRLGTEYFDVQVNTDPQQPDRLFNEATAALEKALGADAQFSEQDVYDQMAAIVAARNEEQLAVVGREKAKGRALISEQLASMMDDPDVGRAMFLRVNPNYATARQQKPSEVRVTESIGTLIGIEDPKRMKDQAFAAIARERLRSIADSYSMTAEELDDAIRTFQRQGYGMRTIDSSATDRPTGALPQPQR